MSNFKVLLSDVLLEKNKSFNDLEIAGIICEREFYQYKDFTPFLPKLIAIANYLQVSLDYLSGRTSENKFRRYSEIQSGFYDKLLRLMNVGNITQAMVVKEAHFSHSNFMYWRKGRTPKLNTLVALADYLNCSIDDLLVLE